MSAAAAAAAAEELESFIEWFYSFVSDRKPLAAFYVNSNAKYAAVGLAADISINGLVCPTPADFEALLETQATGKSAGAATNGVGSSNGATANGGAFKPNNASSSTPISQRVRYDVDSFDVHVLNPQFRLACPDQLLQRLIPTGPSGSSGTASSSIAQLQQKMASLLVQVTGHVVYGGGKDAVRGPFTEVLVLVPNWDVLIAGARAPRGLRSHLILSQNFRAL
ncbi:hypothetical protein CMQ_739 [Grosmannia clavigera kw1407]|uniref:NTF2 domain-containing protein n=1 Tax=Grosmannia clavigera (strain kw1407 / UAMH 11150) TaxID=655863 RepID=F0XEC0_GROCL|nr:uncharacterized protein CMQ_739 [Grosmannia clavigera kw1407]EFX03811.1 hypothetical protein CMQ_739 [Grosmannia clavigera kw1407]